MKEFFKSKKYIYGLFILITLLQLTHIIYTFQVKKESLNSDEIWSYCYANSYYDNSIFEERFEDGERITQNLETWVDCKTLWDFLVVNKGEEFAYGSVYSNHLNDLSPPFHSMVLHTICSIFPETFSWWYGFSINIVAFLITMIFLFLAIERFQNSYLAILVCTFYGFTQNCVDNFIYLRPYALCTAFFAIILYQTMKLLTMKGKTTFWQYLRMGIVAFLGFMTHFYFIAAVGILTMCVCIYLLFTKQYKRMLCYGLTMLAALILMFLAFPVMTNTVNGQVTSVATKTEKQANYNFEIRFKCVLNMMLYTVIGFGVPIFGGGGWKIALGVIIFVGIVMLPLLFLFRESAVVRGIFSGIYTFVHRPLHYIWMGLTRLPWRYILMVIFLLAYITVVAQTSIVYGMGLNGRRYTFFLTPVLVLLLIGILDSLLCLLIRCQRVYRGITLAVILFFLGINVHIFCMDRCPEFYFARDTKGMTIEKAITDSSVIYVDNENWLIYAWADRLMYGKEYFQVPRYMYDDYEMEYIEKLKNGNPLVVVLNVDFRNSDIESAVDGVTLLGDDVIAEFIDKRQKDYNELIVFFENLVPETEMELLSKETVFQRDFEVYLLNPSGEKD